ncbi:hypothetical protein AMAG_19840 [Allomyces macrogynus ATCC 38327]|uniref:Uncharacterized protein n=1 Tax=Allomyces macrogynus (strain ATCC 38327) TaxID=578462 RepID=A0A0L0T0F1_ALLM3|nr:hypothetical protein AMAG_19840 [Allomyces macrogynus ATCC 38327]|eukprot:KNE68054.1 hypothetical protein AMAG_19840 [Allomyces macrogynus ATCC 38327]
MIELPDTLVKLSLSHAVAPTSSQAHRIFWALPPSLRHLSVWPCQASMNGESLPLPRARSHDTAVARTWSRLGQGSSLDPRRPRAAHSTGPSPGQAWHLLFPAFAAERDCVCSTSTNGIPQPDSNLQDPDHELAGLERLALHFPAEMETFGLTVLEMDQPHVSSLPLLVSRLPRAIKSLQVAIPVWNVATGARLPLAPTLQSLSLELMSHGPNAGVAALAALVPRLPLSLTELYLGGLHRDKDNRAASCELPSLASHVADPPTLSLDQQ